MTFDVHQLDLFLLVGSAVTILAILAVRVSSRAGLPSLLIYLLMGVVLGEKFVGIQFENAAVAQALGAEKLVFLSDVNGVRRDKNDPDSLIHSLTAKDAGRLIGEGAIEAGMIPKVEACLETLQKGVRKIHIIDGRIRHSLMLEIYTNQGIGTEIVAL